MENITDIHIHIIPNVDDGANNISTAYKMMQMLYEQGVRNIIATPHDYAYLYNAKQIHANSMTLQKIFPKIKIHLGCEIFCKPHCMESVIYNLNHNIYPTMNNTQYVLVEFSTRETDVQNVVYCVDKLLNNGYTPIIAHIERYKIFTFDNMQMLKRIGCMLQTNIYSLQNEIDTQIKNNARIALKNKLIDFIGSDSHRMSHRPPKLNDGLKYIDKIISDEEYKQKITQGNANKLLEIGVR